MPITPTALLLDFLRPGRHTGVMRTEIFRPVLTQAKTGAFLITNPLHLRYILGSGVDHGLLLILPRRAVLFANEAFLHEPDRLRSQGLSIQLPSALPRALAKVDTCGFESDAVTVDRVASWKRLAKSTKFIPKAGLLQESRRAKDATELRAIRRAIGITRSVLDRVPGHLRSSISEAELARQLQIWALELGADGMAFPTIVAFGDHTANVHHMPGRRRLQQGHIVQIDMGAKVDDYCSDMSDVFFTMPPTKRQQHVYDTVCEAKDAARALVRPGASSVALDQAARAVLRREGMEDAFCHTLGHGVGMEIHEGVQLSHRGPDQSLLRHEVITIEPGVYLPGKFGMRLEETIIVA